MKLFNTKGKRALLITATVLLILVIVCAIYVSDYYRADKEQIEAFMPNMTTEVYKSSYITVGNEDSEIGFVFYPGGKVEYDSYLPLMRALSSEGVFCVLYEMPFNLAVLDINAADGICDEYPLISTWYIGGHSLGGSMAASYLSDNTDAFSGLILLGAYSTADISDTGARVLSLYGSEDGVMNREKYENNKKNLPADFSEIIIEGGSHAYFGMYGEQSGDGIATLTPEEQILFTAEAIVDFLYE